MSFSAIIQKIIAKLDLDKIAAGGIIDFETLNNKDRETAVKMAIHCCINGPVGVNKTTNFPAISEQMAIKDVINCTNKSWTNFCQQVADLLPGTVKSQVKEQYGSLWPTCKDQYKAGFV
jgi:hypothetical protein